MSGKNEMHYCSFCRKSQNEVRKLIAGPNDVFICDECIELCNDIIAEELAPDGHKKATGVPTPEEIVSLLDQYVIGQEKAKKILSVAVYEHYKRIRHNKGAQKDVEMAKSNILLIGPTGCGKTLLAETLARSLDVPFVTVDVTPITEAGYVGGNVEDIILKLLQKCDYDVARAQEGIIYIDEIDKIAGGFSEAVKAKDISGEGVQKGLLRLLEGTVVSVTVEEVRNNKNKSAPIVQVDTTNILFICGGAFARLPRMIHLERGGNSIGFNAEVYNVSKQEDAGRLLATVEPRHLVQFGFVPEFVGRLPVVAVLEALSVSALTEILVKPKNALIRQQVAMLAMDGVEIEFTQAALESIAKEAIRRGSGARGLRSIVERALLELKYKLPTLEKEARKEGKRMSKVTIDEECIKSGVLPIVTLAPSPPAP